VESGASSTAADEVTSAAARARRPWWIWGIPFAAVFGVLLVRNRFLFDTRFYESGDSGANSILIEQAMHFKLLVGNYSREGFNHPGPAYMYVQAFGEWLARDVLRVVPTDRNGQLLAVFGLNSAFLAIAVGIGYGWTRSVRGAAACFVAVLGFAALYPEIMAAGWMPDMYVMAFFVFLLAAASVAAGRANDLWALALSGGFLIHGHACFLFFTPAIAGPAAVAAAWPYRRSLWASARAFLRDRKGAWVPAVVISAVFATPILINLALHWPGDFAKYFAYGSSSQAGGHTFGQVLRFALWFWWPHQHAWIAPLALGAIAVVTTARLARGPLRRFLFTLLGVNVVASLAFLVYAAVGIDDLTETYIGYFYWSVPFLTVLVIAVALFQAATAKVLTPAIVLASAAGLAAVAFVPGLNTGLGDNEPGLPGVVAAIAARDPGKPIVLVIDDNAWPDTTGFLVQAERTHVRACVDQTDWEFMMTAQFMCTPHEVATGAQYLFRSPAPRFARPVVLRFGSTTVIQVK
jgi:hypothetical protein